MVSDQRLVIRKLYTRAIDCIERNSSGKHVKSPLHMEVGQHRVDIALKTTLELDQEVRKDQGLFSDEVELLLSSLKEEVSKGIELTNELDIVKQLCELNAEDIVEFKEKHQESTKRVNNKFPNSTHQDRRIQKELRNIEKKEKELKENLKSLKKLVSIQEGNVKDINSNIEDIKGPFTKDLDEVIDSMKLRRVAYHAGFIRVLEILENLEKSCNFSQIKIYPGNVLKK